MHVQYFQIKPGLPLERGGYLSSPVVAYHTYGNPRNPVVWVCHALTANSDVFGWWAGLFGPDAPFNPKDHYIVCANILGSCYGTTGPLSQNPETGEPYFHDFPVVTVRDMVAAHEALRNHLNIKKIHLLIGGSLGGQQALEWAILQPDAIENLALIATNARHSAWGIAFNEAQRMAIEADPAWAGGRYAPGHGPTAGLAAARAIAMITYRSQVEFGERFGRLQTRVPGRFDIEHYLRRHGEKLVQRFDARTYVQLMHSMDLHDVGEYAPAGRTTARRVGEVVGVGIDTDILYFPSEVRAWVEGYRRGGANARYAEIVTPYGHDAFLIEFGQVERILRGS